MPNNWNTEWRLLRGCVTIAGYTRLALHHDRNQKPRSYLSHRLTAEAFFGPPPSKSHHVNHIDGCKQNNSASNLEWATPAENDRHATENGLKPYGSGHWAAKLTDEQVREIRAVRGLETYEETAARYNVHKTTIGSIQRREQWKRA